MDDPRPVGETDILFNRYHRLGYWKKDRRGDFPWDIMAWRHRRLDLDELSCGKLTLLVYHLTSYDIL